MAIGYSIKTQEGESVGFLVASAHQPLMLSSIHVRHLELIANSTTTAYFELLRQDHPPQEQQKISFHSRSLKQAIELTGSEQRYKCIASLGDQSQFSRRGKQPNIMPSFLKGLNAAMDWPVQAAAGIAFTGPLIVNDRNYSQIPFGTRLTPPDAMMLSAFRRRMIRLVSLETWYEQTASDRELSEIEALKLIEDACEGLQGQGHQMAMSIAQLEALYAAGAFDQIRMLFEQGFQKMQQNREWAGKFLRREKLMAERIDSILKTATKSSTISFVIGVAHLGGDGLVSRLRNMGYTLESLPINR